MDSWKQAVCILIVGILCIALQSSVLSVLLPPWTQPNLLILIAVFLAFYFPTMLGSFFSFVIGLQYDLTSGLLVGPWAGVMVLTFGLVAALSQRIFVESSFAIFVAVVLMAITGDLIYLLLSGSLPDSITAFLSEILGGSVVTGFVAIPVFKMLRNILFPRQSYSFANYRR